MRRATTSRCIAWLVAAALIAQSWLGQLATSAVAAEVDGIVICTSAGFEIVSLPDGLGPPAASSESDDGRREHGLNCTACLAQAATDAITSPPPGLVPWNWHEAHVTVVSEALAISSLSHRAHPSRAPPFA